MPKRKLRTYQSYADFSDDEKDVCDGNSQGLVVERHVHSDFFSTSRTAKRTVVESVAPSVTVVPVPDYNEWAPPVFDVGDILHNDFNEQTTDQLYHFWMDPTFAQYPETLEDLAPKESRNRPSDHPLRVWLTDRDTYLRECLRLEGRGGLSSDLCTCGSLAHFRCTICVDPSIWCQVCIVARHQITPLHRIEEWKGTYFRRRSLASLGLRISLGHRTNESCVCPRPVNNFVIISLDGLHIVNVNFCDCERAETHPIQLLRARLFPATSSAPQTASTFEVLRMFQLLTFMSKCSAYEFYQCLSRLTENTGTSTPPDRYKAFLSTARQWRHIKLTKRFGRGHDPAGVAATREGECAVLCPACPQPGINLPTDYSTRKDSWKYALFLGFDGNFRLKRLNVSNDQLDPGLNDGFAFCVENRRYHEFLNSFQDTIIEQQSTCNDHRAIKHAQTRSGIRMGSTGLATIDCSRHDMKRPCALGDFQKGERQINIDYCLLSSLRHQVVTHLILSYDVICQWGVNFKRRIEQYATSYPELTRPIAKAKSARFLVPKYHLRAHRDYCKARFDFHLTPGVGMADGEAPERGWAAANGLANSTKEMGPGHRRDVLDDFFGDFNWRKTTTLAGALCRKLEEAIPAAAQHQAEFQQLSDSLPKDLIREWETQVVAWETSPNSPGVTNPYDVVVQAITLAKVRKQLAEEERVELERSKKEVLPEVTPQGMLVQGLEIEELQYRHHRDRKQIGSGATLLQESKVIESANRLQRRIDGWLQAQQFYIPGAAIARRRTPPPDSPADIPLFLPSACLAQKIKVSESLLRIEHRLRIAEANDALASLRGCLMTRDRMWKYKDAHIRGQRDSGRANSTIQSVNDRIDAEATRYRKAFAALTSLSVPLAEVEWKDKLRPLSDADVKGLKWKDNEIRLTEESESRRHLPWIWKTEGIIVGDDPQTDRNVNEALRIEWCRARARSRRWKEECILLIEEMRRVREFFQFQRDAWSRRSKAIDWCTDPSVREGLAAYALRQADIRNAMLLGCERLFAAVNKTAETAPVSV